MFILYSIRWYNNTDHQLRDTMARDRAYRAMAATHELPTLRNPRTFKENKFHLKIFSIRLEYVKNIFPNKYQQDLRPPHWVRGGGDARLVRVAGGEGAGQVPLSLIPATAKNILQKIFACRHLL